MDSSFSIKPSAPAGRSRAVRDPVPVREAVETELVGSRTVAAAAGNGSNDGEGKNDGRKPSGQPLDHAPQDLVADPNSRDVIYRERDVRSIEREHPDQALLRERAYHRPAVPDQDASGSSDPHADIKA